MPKFIIERKMPGVGNLSPLDLCAISQKSCAVLQELGTDLQWVESFVTDDKVYCVFIAPDESAIREHAKRGGFPVTQISRVRALIDPTTAESWSVKVNQPKRTAPRK